MAPSQKGSLGITDIGSDSSCQKTGLMQRLDGQLPGWETLAGRASWVTGIPKKENCNTWVTWKEKTDKLSEKPAKKRPDWGNRKYTVQEEEVLGVGSESRVVSSTFSECKTLAQMRLRIGKPHQPQFWHPRTGLDLFWASQEPDIGL